MTWTWTWTWTILNIYAHTFICLLMGVCTLHSCIYNIFYGCISLPTPHCSQLSPYRKFIYYNKHFSLKISKSIELTTFSKITNNFGKEKSSIVSSRISVFVTLPCWKYSNAAFHLVCIKIKSYAVYWRTS